MMDQAQSLRQLVSSQDSKVAVRGGSSARIITVCSGKGALVSRILHLTSL